FPEEPKQGSHSRIVFRNPYGEVVVKCVTEEQLGTQITVAAIFLHVSYRILTGAGCLTPTLAVFIGIQSSLESISTCQEESSFHFVGRMVFEKIFRDHDGAVHVGEKSIAMRLVGRVRPDLPPLDPRL